MLGIASKSNGNLDFCEKMAVDLLGKPSLVHGMDEDTAELVSHLCTRIGIIMEDASVVALTLGSSDAEQRADGLQQLERSASQISRLLQAALVLHEGGWPELDHPT